MNREHAEKPMTDEAFSEMLVANLSEASDSELKEMQAALRSYRAETLMWAERRSAAMPSLKAEARRSRMWAMVPQWSLAAVAVLTVAVGIAHVAGDRTQETPGGAPMVAVHESAPASQAEIAADNSLLTNIDTALRYDADSPAVSIGLDADAAPVRARHTDGVTN